MAVTEVFKEAVESKSVRKIRIMMEDSLLVDPTFTKFEEMKKLAATVDGLYDKHDGRSFRQDKNSWDDDYMDELMVHAIDNFSHERVNHLKEVVHYLRPVKENPVPAYSTKQSRNSDKIKNNISQKRKSTYQKEKERDKQEGNYLGTKVAAGMVAGAAMGAAVAIAIEASVSTGILAGAAVVGTITYFGTERKE